MKRNLSEGQKGLLHQIRQSISPLSFIPRTESERKRYFIQHLIFHFRPSSVPEKTLRFSLSWGLGGMATLLIVLQVGSGVLLKFVYEPTPAAAYRSIQTLISTVSFGRLIRNLHHWCAHLLVLVIFFHMLRVFLTGAFHPPRQFNWIVGLVLFTGVLIANFTGYLMPWDQLAYWAVTVSTGMLEYIPVFGSELQTTIRGGTDIGPATLSVFYAIHTAVVPLFLLSLTALHFWRIRKAGGLVLKIRSAPASIEQPHRVPSLPNLLLREVVVASMLVAAVLWFSVFFDAPLAEPANPGLSPNPTKAPWYFAGLQELLLHLHPVFAVFIVPLMIGFALAAVPYMQYKDETGGTWFISQKGRRMGLIAAITALFFCPLLILADEWLLSAGKRSSAISSVFVNGLVPTFLLLSAVILFNWILKRLFSPTKNESVQTLFILLSVAFGVLTIVGVYLRGPSMALTFPW